MSQYPGFIGPSSTQQSLLANPERLVNWYLEPVSMASAPKRKAVYYPTPGSRPWLSVSDVGTRGMISVNGRSHAVVGTGVYELFATASATKRGTAAQDNNLVSMTYNGAAGNVVCFASGGLVYYLNLATNVLTTVSGVAALQVGMLDEYFIAFDPVSGKIRLSPLNDTAGVWDPTQFALRSIAPDPWKAMITADKVGTREVWLIGEQTGEVWYDAGTFPFPLAPIPGALFKFGTPAPSSVAAAGSTVLWLSQTAEGAGIVVAASGYTPQRISTSAVETAIATYQRMAIITDAEALVYQQEGHTFYCLRFPAANATWAYDLTTGAWFELGYWNSALNRYDAWHPRVHTYAFGQHLVGEAGTGTLSVLDITYGLESDGAPIRRLRRAPGLFDEGRRIPIHRFEVYLDTDPGVVSGQGSDPRAMLRTSGNGGKTWSSERSARTGKIGEYGTPVYWTRCGSLRNFVPEFVVSDPVPWRILDCFVNNDGQAA